jgi:chromosome segregation ATPase
VKPFTRARRPMAGIVARPGIGKKRRIEMTKKQIEAKIAALKASIAGWMDKKAEHQNSQSELDAQVAALRSRSNRDHDEDAGRELEALRTFVDFTRQETRDLADEIAAAQQEITELEAQREAAARDELWELFREECKAAIVESKEIEKHLAGFAKAILPHRDRLARLSMLAQSCGVDRQLDGRHLWRKILSTLHTLSPFEIGRQHASTPTRTPEILKRMISATERAHAPEQTTAVNE